MGSSYSAEGGDMEPKCECDWCAKAIKRCRPSEISAALEFAAHDKNLALYESSHDDLAHFIYHRGRKRGLGHQEAKEAAAKAILKLLEKRARLMDRHD